jgi:hypothetical protein
MDRRTAPGIVIACMLACAGGPDGRACAQESDGALEALGRALRASTGYGAREADRVLGEIARADTAIREARTSDACRALAQRRRDALVALVTADAALAPAVWEASRRVAAGAAECARSSDAAMADASVRAEVAGWLGARSAPPEVGGSPSARDLAARGWALLAADHGEQAVEAFTAALAAIGSDRMLAADVLRGLGVAERDDGCAHLAEAVRRATSAGAAGRRALADALVASAECGDAPARWLSIYDRARAARRAIAGASDPWTAQIDRLRLGSLRELNRFEEAVAASRAAVAAYRDALGATHPQTLDAYQELASAAEAGTDYAAATTAQAELLAIEEQLYGAESGHVVHRLGELGRNQSMSGHRDDAERSYRRAVELFDRLPRGDRRVEPPHERLALLLSALGRHEEALATAERFVAARRESHRDDSAEVRNAWDMLARMADRAGRPERAAEARAASRAGAAR